MGCNSTESYNFIISTGRAALGNDATLKEICDYVGPQYGFTGKELLQIYFGIKEEEC